MLLTKDEARREVLRRWHALPPNRRRTFDDAAAFAASPEGCIEFQTVANPQKIVTAWLIRDLVAAEQIALAVPKPQSSLPPTKSSAATPARPTTRTPQPPRSGSEPAPKPWVAKTPTSISPLTRPPAAPRA